MKYIQETNGAKYLTKLMFNKLRVELYEITDHNVLKDDSGDFKRMVGNRKVDEAHVNKIKTSIKKNGLLFNPIITDEHLNPADGQHFLRAAAEEGQPVIVAVCPGYNGREMAAYNSVQSNWGWKDHMENYIEKGYDDYKKYKKFYSTYGLNHNLNIRLLSDDITNTNTSFKEGDFVYQNIAKAKSIADKLYSFKEHIGNSYSRRDFCISMMLVFEAANYNHERMIKIVKKGGVDFSNTSPAEYLVHLEKTYNHKLQKEDTIDFLSLVRRTF